MHTEIAPSEYPKQLIVESMFKSDLICEFSGIFTESTTIQSLASLTEIVCHPPLKQNAIESVSPLSHI